jgi:hypothetical protein
LEISESTWEADPESVEQMPIEGKFSTRTKHSISEGM